MKKSLNIWQRLLAFVMVCTMLVSYVPVFAAAEGDPAYEAITGFTATLVCTTTAEETTEIRNTDEPELDGEGNPVVDGEGNPVYKTEEIIVFKKIKDTFTVEGAPEGALIEWSENNVLISSNGRNLKASIKAPETVTQLETVTTQEVIWKASVLAWDNIAACTPISTPPIEYGEGCSLEPVEWTITDEGGKTYKVGEDAHMSMGTLTATATIGEQTFTRTAKVTYAAAEYQISPEGGWFTEMPEVITVTATTANPVEDIAPVYVNGSTAGYEWTVNEEVPGSYIVTIPGTAEETTKTVAVADVSKTYNVDNTALNISNIYAIRYDDKTEVNFTYTAGASGATALINGKEVTLDPGEGNECQCFLDGAIADIQVKMTNVLGKEATANCVSIPYPTITATSPIIGYVNGVAYVGKNANYISFTMTNAYGDVTWKVESELEISNYTTEGNEIKIYVSPDAPFNVPVGASATDSRGRYAIHGGYAAVAVDMIAPEVTITGLQTAEETHVPAEQTYTIKATDDVVLSTVSARYYLENDNEGTEIAITNGEGSFTQTDGQHLKKIVVTALDVSGNETVETWETDVVVDTTAPVLSASISAFAKDADGNYTIPANVEAIYVVNDEPYLKFSTVDVESNDENLKVDGSIMVQVAFSANEANIADENWQDGVEYVIQIVEENNVEKFAISGITIKDKAGNVPVAPLAITIGGDESGTKLPLDLVSGVYSGSVWVDRRSPEDNVTDDGEAPVVTMKITSENYVVENGLPIFKAGTASFSLAVKDDSGLVPTVVTSVNGDGVSTAGSIELDAAGNGVVNVTVAEAKGNQDCQLRVQVYDVAGNYYIYILNFGIDSMAPEMNYSIIHPQDDTFVADDGNYHQKNVTVNFTLSDQLPAVGTAECTITNDNTKADESKIVTLQATEVVNDRYTATGTLVLENGQRLTNIKLIATDALDNSITKNHPLAEIVDRDAPELKITVTPSDEEKADIQNKIHKYEKAVKITVEYMDENYNGEPVLEYELENAITATEFTKTDILNENGEVKGNKYELVISDEGALLKFLRVTGTDKANNISSQELGYGITIDARNPDVTVTRVDEEHYIQTADGTSYYNGPVTYNVSIYDWNLDKDSIEVLFNGKQPTYVTLDGSDTTYSASYVIDGLEENDILHSIQITAKDTWEHGASVDAEYLKTSVSDEGGNIVFKQVDEDTIALDTENSNTVVVDIDNPEITGTISATATGFLNNDDISISGYIDAEGEYYIVLKPVEEHGNDEKGNEVNEVKGTVNVKLNFTLNEKNPDVTKFFGLESNGWTESNGQWIYTVEKSVKENETAVIKVEGLSALDMAARVPDAKITLEFASNQTEGLSNVLELTPTEGKYNVAINIDRRTPENSENTDAVPEITVTSKNEKIKDTEIYIGNAVTFDLVVKDVGAGIDTLFTAEVEGKGYHHDEEVSVEENQVFVKGENGKYTGAVTVNIANGAESNNITLNLYIKDKVGNTYHLVKNFGLDNHAPEVDVKFTENAGDGPRNVFYYKGNRHATVTVKDINLADDIDSVVQISTVMNNTTAVAASKAEKNGDTITLDYDYTADGDYTFAVTNVVDKAGHNVADQNVKYADSNRSEKDHNFTIDKTKPKIEVAYAPAAASGRDGTVSHYNQVMTAYATITEHNFSTGAEDEAGVVTNITPAGSAAFGNWSDDGDDHKSSATFQEGNNYSFTINCTDLAGNIADTYTSHTFCVDTHAPTIEITAGSLTNEELNIVQDDLTLGFTINDAQKNLSNYNVTVTKLGNDFKKTTITGEEFYTVSEQEARTTVLVNFRSIAKEKLNDGVYTVEITARDFAGNAVSLTPGLVFSLNRFGSTFMTDDEYTLKFLEVGSDGNVYHQEVSDKLIIHEINPNRVYSDSSKKIEGSALTVIVNGTSTKLEEGKNYSMNISEQGSEKSRWYVYTYQIDPDTFMDDGKVVDGRYSILISGEDEAGNKNTNESNVSGKLQKNKDGEYTGKIEFILDTTSPIITTTGIESGKNYDAEAQKLQIFLSDSTPTAITVYLNGNPVALTELLAEMDDATQWLVYDEESNSYILNVPELNTLFSGQEIRIVVVDEAGNETELFINDFSVSTNLFVRLLNSTWFIISVIVLAILLIVMFLLKKRKKVAV